MGFELTIAMARDPLAGRGQVGGTPRAMPATVTLTGPLQPADVSSVAEAVSRANADGAGSVLVVFDGVTIDGDACGAELGRALMALRARGVHVQARCNDRTLHARLAADARSRDWLLGANDGDDAGPRVALHFDASKRTDASD